MGLILLALLIMISMFAFMLIPLDTFKQWHNPAYWTKYPKSVPPVWVNYFTASKLPEHLTLNKPQITEERFGGIRSVSHSYSVNFQYDGFPNDFMLNFAVRYRGLPPLVEFSVLRPDGDRVTLIRLTLPPKPVGTVFYSYNSTIFSTDRNLKSNVAQYIAKKTGLAVSVGDILAEISVFAERGISMAEAGEAKVLRGIYGFTATFFLFDEEDKVLSSELIIGGRVFGLLGTDEVRRDLSVGVMWGTPVALLIGLSVALLAVFIGVVYGVVSGYHGRRLDEGMMRINDLMYALPALPFLIILTLSLGRSMIFIVLYLVLFGWVGTAKVARSIALQVKTMPYVEAAELLGASRWRVMFKHVMPQIVPFAVASIALAVPGAILTEAGLSFLGLGDPALPTWGQILHDANLYSAAARGMWWWLLPPGVMIAIAGLSFVLIGSALDAVLNPKMRRI